MLLMMVMPLYVSAIEVVNDTPEVEIHKLFQSGKARYVLRYSHQFIDTLQVPSGSEILFDGGQLSGPIIFYETNLSGIVNLKGSSIGGKISNKTFDASW